VLLALVVAPLVATDVVVAAWEVELDELEDEVPPTPIMPPLLQPSGARTIASVKGDANTMCLMGGIPPSGCVVAPLTMRS